MNSEAPPLGIDGSPHSWCILRTAPSRTLRLVAALADAGFTVWTPTIQETKRIARSRKRKVVSVPMIPGFVFAQYDRVQDLYALSRSPAQTYQVWDSDERRMVTRGCPYFTTFRHLERFAWVDDCELDPLRLTEQRGRPKEALPTFRPGDKVKHPESGFEGLVGTVQETRGRYTLVMFAGLSIPVQIDPQHLIAA